MIEWEGISFSYPGQEDGGLQQVNLRAAKGECILFCGRSGCGKTTMLRFVNGLIPSFFDGETAGKLWLDGQDVLGLPMYRLAEQVGSVFQNPRTQFFNVDTDSEIAFGIENEALPPKELENRVEKTAKDLKIEDLRGRSIFEISGGEKQKIAFASVYAMNPDVYVLDEPSSNLDFDSIQELREHLLLVKDQGKTILIAEHRLYYLMGLADRIVYLEKGRIQGIYTPEAFMAISLEQRIRMGLRSIYPQEMKPQRKQAAAAPILEVKDVTIRYKKRTVLEHVSLKAGRGEVIAVVGQNGAGKTTFSRTLCGLHREYEGQFFWEGKPFDVKSRCKKSYMVMQDVGYQLFAESVEKECIFGVKNPDEELASRTLKELGLSDFTKKHPNTLSGGQKQRLAVAVGRVCGKDILVFDEPTSGLDYDGMVQVASMFDQLAEQGSIIFVVTHDYELICHGCTRILCLREGRLQADMLVTEDNSAKLWDMSGIT